MSNQKIICEHCSAKLIPPKSLIGKFKIKCKACGEYFYYHNDGKEIRDKAYKKYSGFIINYNRNDNHWIKDNLQSLSNYQKEYYFDQFQFEIEESIKPIIDCKLKDSIYKQKSLPSLLEYTIFQYVLIKSFKESEILPKQLMNWTILGGFFDKFLKKDSPFYPAVDLSALKIIYPSSEKILSFVKFENKADRYVTITKTDLNFIIENDYRSDYDFHIQYYRQCVDEGDIGEPVVPPDLANLEKIKNYRIKILDTLLFDDVP